MPKRSTKKNNAVKNGYFDLNIPYIVTESGKLSAARKKTRLKTIIKAMELGYTGVAYNHSIKGGAMSNSDNCNIIPIPLSSILQVAPNISTTVKFHRELLGVPISSPFRQFTRLTVAVDSKIQTSAWNSGNLAFNSYDLVAVRPLNQITFDEVATNKDLKVDLIAIDFSEKIPFRMDFQTVKKAIELGIYFEITYSSLVSDVQARKQMISNCKLLMEWTRGKNLIFSSATASANELRGPNDVVNLSSLLGLPMKRARSAISENCRVLLGNAIKKKRYFKGAIRVERISTILDSKEAWTCNDDGNEWDPISSGEGDLMLNDTSNLPKSSTAMDLSSVADEMTSSGFSLKGLLSNTLI